MNSGWVDNDLLENPAMDSHHTEFVEFFKRAMQRWDENDRGDGSWLGHEDDNCVGLKEALYPYEGAVVGPSLDPGKVLSSLVNMVRIAREIGREEGAVAAVPEIAAMFREAAEEVASAAATVADSGAAPAVGAKLAVESSRLWEASRAAEAGVKGEESKRRKRGYGGGVEAQSTRPQPPNKLTTEDFRKLKNSYTHADYERLLRDVFKDVKKDDEARFHQRYALRRPKYTRDPGFIQFLEDKGFRLEFRSCSHSAHRPPFVDPMCGSCDIVMDIDWTNRR